MEIELGGLLGLLGEISFTAKLSSNSSYVYYYPTRACAARGKVIGLSIVNTKIARSEDLGI